MIIGIGTDLVDIRRIDRLMQRFGDRLIKKLLRPEEYADTSPLMPAFVAKRFAGKEAILKALGTGLAGGMHWHDMVIVRNERGKPTVILHNNAKALLDQLTPSGRNAAVDISLTDEYPYAQAFVVIAAF